MPHLFQKNITRRLQLLPTHWKKIIQKGSQVGCRCSSRIQLSHCIFQQMVMSVCSESWNFHCGFFAASSPEIGQTLSDTSVNHSFYSKKNNDYDCLKLIHFIQSSYYFTLTFRKYFSMYWHNCVYIFRCLHVNVQHKMSWKLL